MIRRLLVSDILCAADLSTTPLALLSPARFGVIAPSHCADNVIIPTLQFVLRLSQQLCLAAQKSIRLAILKKTYLSFGRCRRLKDVLFNLNILGRFPSFSSAPIRRILSKFSGVRKISPSISVFISPFYFATFRLRFFIDCRTTVVTPSTTVITSFISLLQISL